LMIGDSTVAGQLKLLK